MVLHMFEGTTTNSRNPHDVSRKLAEIVPYMGKKYPRIRAIRKSEKCRLFLKDNSSIIPGHPKAHIQDFMKDLPISSLLGELSGYQKVIMLAVQYRDRKFHEPS
ncbi:hypothetical protein [Oryza sativa Japonica Group]|uniref:Uncharacterized protein OJ1126_G08.4 n=1 Tax=Oryza sativa subsp. japonica TaxID=39947 RepID=Q5VNI3_ORYSJ|nr:hypothetical protein [Oryza sativa Japonica Group]